MSESPHNHAIGIAAAAYKALAFVQGKQKLATQRRMAEEQGLRDDEAKRAHLLEQEDEDKALRHLDGDEAAPVKPQRVKALAALSEKIPLRKASIPVLKQREAEVGREAEVALAPFTEAIIDAVVAIQQPAVERIRQKLAELEAPLRDLLTADMIQLATIGDRFSISVGQTPPFSGGTIVRKLLNSIPVRLLPTELNEKRLEAAARAESTVAIRQIKENR